MITSQILGLYGRLGNQLFQYATLYSLGKELNYKIGVPYHHKNNNDKLHFAIPDGFNITANASQNKFFSSVYIESSFDYDSNIWNIPDGCDIRGYFQTEKYFKKYKNELIKTELTFKPNVTSKVNNILNGNNSELISIHIRLCDYQQLKNSHPPCTKDYYHEALKLLPNDANIILFSDDYSTALNLMKDFNINVMLTGTGDKFVDLCMMSKCNYHIIANSSFSWWGAWLSNSKKVIAPNLWFGSDPAKPKSWNDIYCEEWEIVNV
jgi:hypothetical protein